MFVYGTLRQGMCNHFYLQDAKPLYLRAWVEGKLYDTKDGYPALVHGNGKVWGEVYQVNQRQLQQIDRLEDYFGPDHPDNLYDRRCVSVYTEQGQIKAYTYYYCDVKRLTSHGIWISAGDWLQYIQQ